jgi:hypothetical protein
MIDGLLAFSAYDETDHSSWMWKVRSSVEDRFCMLCLGVPTAMGTLFLEVYILY